LVSLIHTLRHHGIEPDLLEAVNDINRNRVRRLFERMTQELGSLSGKVIGVLGLAFKPDTDDIREAKAIELIELLLKAGALVQAYDPQAMDKARERLPDVRYCENVYEAA